MTRDTINDKLSIVDEKRKDNVYIWIKIAGLLSFVPFVLAAGPLGGYFLGSYLEKKFGFPQYITFAIITIGFIGSIRETIRIIKAALRSEKE